MSSRIRIFLASLVTVGAATACLNPPVEAPTTTVVQQTPVRVPQNANNAVDVLFMVDNSLSMDAMQAELKSKFGDFLQVFQDLAKNGTAADLHIGVVTSDYGAGATGAGSCAPYGNNGQGGLLVPKGATADANCQPPTNNLPYISYVYAGDSSGNGSGNLPAGQDLQTTFTCMASVGSNGCGFEAQLESAYQGLKNTNQNAGFLRDSALLAVVFVTNEDDGSAGPKGAMYDQSNTSTYGDFDTYRQTRFGVFCNNAPIPYGDGMDMANLQNCAAAPNSNDDPGLLIDISKYQNAFKLPLAQGGIKTFPTDVLLFAIDGPVSPFSTILANPQSGLGTTTGLNGQPTTPNYSTCGPTLNSTTCQMRLQHSCQNQAQPAFFADPAVRIQAVVQSVMFNQTSSICGEDLTQPPDFTKALTDLGMLISSQISPGCIPAKLEDASNPQCIVDDVTEMSDGTEKIVPIPACATAPANTFPCWKVEQKKACATLSPDGVGISIDRNGMDAPPNTNASVECSTVPTVTM